MRIAFYCTEPVAANIDNYPAMGVSGTVSAMLLASHGLARRGHEVFVLNRSESGVYQGTRHVRTRSPEDVDAALQSIGPVDVFVANGWAAEIFLDRTIEARRRVYWVHNFVHQEPYENAIRSKRLDYIFCISRNQLGTWYRSPVFSRITNIYNCVDLRAFEGIRPGAVRDKKIMFVGAPRESKGFHDALRVFDTFVRRHPGFKLYVAGAADLHASADLLSDNGIFEREYEERCLNGLLRDAGGRIRDDVVLLGKIPRQEVIQHLATTLVALQNPSWTSQPEVHSVAAMEAQMMGVPVVSTFRGGQPEVIRDGWTGILAKRRDDAALVNALDRIASDERLAAAMSARAIEHVRRRFTIDAAAAEWDRALAVVAAGGRFRGNLLRAIRSKIRHKLHI